MNNVPHIQSSNTAPLRKLPAKKVTEKSVPLPEDRAEIGVSPSPERDWTMLVYSAGVKNIDSEVMESAKNLEKAGSDENLAIILQRSRNPVNPADGWKGARRYYIVKSDNPDNKEISSPVLKDLGDVDMSNPKNLESFIEWGMKNYPAKHTMVVLGGHSAGFAGAITDPDQHHLMSLPEISGVYEKVEDKTGKKPDVTVFNSCLMSQAEVAAEFEGKDGYLVASEKPEYETGIPLGEFAESLKESIEEKGTVSPKDAARKLTDEISKTPGLVPAAAAIDLDANRVLTQSIDNLSLKLMETGTPKAILKKVIEETAKTYVTDKPDPLLSEFRDLSDFLTKLSTSKKVRDKKLKAAAKDTQRALNRSVIRSTQAGFEELPQKEREVLEKSGVFEEDYDMPFKGISIYLPLNPPDESLGPFKEMIIDDKYENLKFNKKTRWLEFIRKLHDMD